MLESALLIRIIGLARSHRWVHEVVSGRPVIQAKPQARAVIRRKQLSSFKVPTSGLYQLGVVVESALPMCLCSTRWVMCPMLTPESW